jgi:nucleoside-diphosphate-sugar epimerase
VSGSSIIEAMTFIPERTAIVGATGPTGVGLARELVGRGRPVRVVSRSRGRLEAAFAELEVEIAEADAYDSEAIRRALDGCDLAVDCIGLPADRMADHPVVARNLMTAVRAVGARALQVSSYWSFLPTRSEVVDESHPREGGNEYARMRRAAEDVFLESGAAVVHLPDFFGPEVHTSTVQMALQQAADGKSMQWIGSASTERESGYVPDLVRVVADLAEREEAYGDHWGLPGSGPVSARRLAEIAGAHLGRRVKVQAAPPWLLKAMSLFNSELRSFLPMVPHYASPVRYRTSKLEGLLGAQQMTPYETAVPATLDWIRAQ